MTVHTEKIQPAPIFISYSRRDDAAQRRIVSYLRERRIPVWVDNEKLTPGTAIWEAEIEKAIKKTSAVVVLMSPDSKDSDWVRREISMADQYKKQIFPVLVRGDEDSAVTLRLITRQFVDLRMDEQAGLDMLSQAIANFLNISIQQAETSETRNVRPVKVKTETRADLDWSFILFVTLGWAFGGALGGGLIWAWEDTVITLLLAGAVAGAIGGFGTASILRNRHMLSQSRSMVIFILGWTFAGAIGLTLGDAITETAGAAIGGAIIGVIGLISTAMTKEVAPDQKSIFLVVLVWFIGAALAWTIGRFYLSSSIDGSTSWPLGYAIGWGFGGFMTTWRLVRAGKNE